MTVASKVTNTLYSYVIKILLIIVPLAIIGAFVFIFFGDSVQSYMMKQNFDDHTVRDYGRYYTNLVQRYTKDLSIPRILIRKYPPGTMGRKGKVILVRVPCFKETQHLEARLLDENTDIPEALRAKTKDEVETVVLVDKGKVTKDDVPFIYIEDGKPTKTDPTKDYVTFFAYDLKTKKLLGACRTLATSPSQSPGKVRLRAKDPVVIEVINAMKEVR